MSQACSNHCLDSLGWPLGNCPGCVAYRKLMSDWHCEMVLGGEARPDYVQPAQAENGDGL